MLRVMMFSAVVVIGVLELFVAVSAQSPPPAEPIGVLIGLRDGRDNFMQSKSPPQIARLRTLWVHGAATGAPAAPVELLDLLVPRRSGFWQVRMAGGCREVEYDLDDKPLGSMTELHASIVAAPAGTGRPDFNRGVCTRTDVNCLTESVATVVWVWPEYMSVMSGGESSCGASSGGSWNHSVQRLGDLKKLSVRDALGARVERSYRQAFEKARREDRDFRKQDPIGDIDDWSKACDDQAIKFDPRAWWIEREQGRWRVNGWTETHRMCGVGFDYVVDADMSRIAGRRADDASRWTALEARWPELEDVHTSPGGRWTVVAAGEEVLIFTGASLDGQPLRMRKDRYEEVVMLEWATGANVSRWNEEVTRLRATVTAQ